LIDLHSLEEMEQAYTDPMLQDQQLPPSSRALSIGHDRELRHGILPASLHTPPEDLVTEPGFDSDITRLASGVQQRRSLSSIFTTKYAKSKKVDNSYTLYLGFVPNINYAVLPTA
jgi:hypothetical protein